MRIEISAGGIGYGTSVMEFSSVFDGFLSNTDNVISCFKTVKNETYSLSGGAGNLQTALDDLESRVRTEESLKENAVLAKAKSDSFLSLAQRIDNQVANDVKKNRDELYSVNSCAKPTTSNEEKKWYEKAWDWLCDRAEDIKEGFLNIGDSLRKIWNSVVEFYQEHKKIIDTVLVIIGVVGALAAIIFTGGAALIPILTALGCSAGVATAISAGVAIIAAITSIASGTLNIIDIWCEIDNDSFQKWKKGLGIASLVFNGIYSIGTIYNSIKGFSYDDVYKYVRESYSKDGISYGGSYAQVKATSDSQLYEVHECPSFSASGDQYRGDLPSIRMEKADHALTGSFGRSNAASAYRSAQAEFLRNGDFSKAFQMDIDDLSQFGFKYAKAIQEMKKYAKLFRGMRGFK